MHNPGRWDTASVALMAAVCALMVWRRDFFPVFQDIYYHLTMAVSFGQAGGVVATDFLHYAPFGRPNLYPPLYHVLLLVPLKLGVGPSAVSAWASAATYPVVLVTLWYVCRAWFGAAASFFSLILFSSSWSVFYGTAYLSPSMLALVLMVWAYHFARGERYAAAACCVALALYCHLTLPHLLVLPLLAVALASPHRRNRFLLAIGCAYALYAPWAVHVIRNRSSIEMFELAQNYSINLLLVACAGAGIAVLCPLMKKRDMGAVMAVSAPLALLPIYSGYAFRYWFHAAFFLAAVGGAALGRLYAGYGTGSSRRVGAVAALACILLLAMSHSVVLRCTYDDESGSGGFSYAIESQPSTYRVHLCPASLSHRSLDKYSENPDIQAVAAGISSLMGQRDVLLVPAGAGFEASFFSAMTGRATTNGMFKEVSPPVLQASEMPPVRAYLAHGPADEAPEGATVVSTSLFSLVVLDNADSAHQSEVPAPAMPWWAAVALVCMAVAAILFDGTPVLMGINKYIKKTSKADT